jgi:hypothetical protein
LQTKLRTWSTIARLRELTVAREQPLHDGFFWSYGFTSACLSDDLRRRYLAEIDRYPPGAASKHVSFATGDIDHVQ